MMEDKLFVIYATNVRERWGQELRISEYYMLESENTQHGFEPWDNRVTIINYDHASRLTEALRVRHMDPIREIVNTGDNERMWDVCDTIGRVMQVNNAQVYIVECDDDGHPNFVSGMQWEIELG